MPEVMTLPAKAMYASPRSLLIPVEPGAPMPELKASAIAAALAVAIAGTTVSGASAPIVRMQDVGYIAPQTLETFAVVEMLRAIRRRTALTWDQLGSILAVSRRSLHHWANGQTVTAENQFKVRKLHDRVGALGDRPAFDARSSILSEYGIPSVPEQRSMVGLPILVADQTPIAAKVNVSRSPRTRIR